MRLGVGVAGWARTVLAARSVVMVIFIVVVVSRESIEVLLGSSSYWYCALRKDELRLGSWRYLYVPHLLMFI